LQEIKKKKYKKLQRKNIFLIPVSSGPDLSSLRRIAKWELRNPRPNPVYHAWSQFRLVRMQVVGISVSVKELKTAKTHGIIQNSHMVAVKYE